MNPIKLFFDKNIYKNIYETKNILNILPQIILAGTILTFLFLYSPIKSIGKLTDLLFVEKMLKYVPKVITYDDNVGFNFFDEDNNQIYKKDFTFVKIDTTKESFNLNDFNKDIQLIIFNKGFFYKNKNKINSFPIEKIGKNFTLKNDYDAISVIQDNKITKNFTLASLTNILNRILFSIKIFMFFSFFFLFIFIFFLISLILSFIYSLILQKKGKSLVFQKLICSFYPILFINIITTFFLSLINVTLFENIIFKLFIISQLNFIIFFVYSIIVTFVFLKDNQKCI